MCTRGMRIPEGFDQPQLGSFLSEAKKDPKGEMFALQANASTIPVKDFRLGELLNFCRLHKY